MSTTQSRARIRSQLLVTRKSNVSREHDIMTIAPGTVGRTICPLSPYGHFEVEGSVHEAKAEGGWIAEGVDVVVVKSTSFAIVVREFAENTDRSTTTAPSVTESQAATGQSTADRNPTSTSVPLHGPDFWLDRVNAIRLGAILWTVVGCILLLTGRPLGFDVLLLPVGGAISGAIFQYFTRGARDLEAAYSDHRPTAYLFAATMLIGAAIGVLGTFSMGAGIGIITGGLVLGTFCGAMLYLLSEMI